MSRGLPLLKGQSLFMKLGHTWARFVRMRYDILDSNGKANIHPGPDTIWNHFGLQKMWLCTDWHGSSIHEFSSELLFPGSAKIMYRGIL